MIDVMVGQWVLFRRSVARDALDVEIAQVEGLEKKRLLLTDASRKTTPKQDVLGVFDSPKLAKGAANRIKSVRGERDRRLMAAHDWATNAVRQLKEGWK